MTRNSGRGWFTFGPVLLAIIVLATGSSVCSAKIKLSVIGNWYAMPSQSAFWEWAAKQYNASQDKVEVELIQGGSEDKITTMVAGGVSPDVVHMDRFRLASWVYRDLVMPLDELLPAGLDVKSTFLGPPLAEATIKGRLYAIPSDTDIRGLFWNTELLEAAGLPAETGPRTWTELNDFARKLTQRDGANKLKQIGFIPWGGNWGPYGWIWAFGGDYYDLKQGKPTLDRVENIKAYDWLQTFAKTMFTPGDLTNSGFTDSSSALFAREKVAMDVAHWGALSDWYRYSNPDIKVWGGPVPYPAGGRNGTWGGGMAFVIPRGAKHPREAMDFILYMCSEEVAARYFRESGQIPTTYKGVEAIKNAIEPLGRVFLAQLPVAFFRRPFTEVMEPYLVTALNDAINLKQDAQSALKKAQEGVLREQARFWQWIAQR